MATYIELTNDLPGLFDFGAVMAKPDDPTFFRNRLALFFECSCKVIRDDEAQWNAHECQFHRLAMHSLRED